MSAAEAAPSPPIPNETTEATAHPKYLFMDSPFKSPQKNHPRNINPAAQPMRHGTQASPVDGVFFSHALRIDNNKRFTSAINYRSVTKALDLRHAAIAV